MAAPDGTRRRAVSPLWKYSVVYRTFGLAAAKLRIASGEGERLPLEEHFELTPYKSLPTDAEVERWRLTRKLIARMRDVAEAGGARFLAVENLHLPEINDAAAVELSAPYDSEFDFDRVTRMFASFAIDADVAFVSLASEAHYQGRTADEIMPPGDTIHLSPEGVRFWAQTVANEFGDRGWLNADGSERAGRSRPIELEVPAAQSEGDYAATGRCAPGAR